LAQECLARVLFALQPSSGCPKCMAAYGLEQLLEDAAERRGSNARLPPLNLAEVWATVDRYAVACLEQKKGLSLPNFCSLAWQVQRLRSRATYRPYFQLASSFSRTYNVDTSRVGPPPQDQDLCPVEDFNFSKAAIRFSGTLTKDHVFTGLRLLIQQLGDVISQGRYVSLEFSFGKVVAKERGVRFAFAAQFYIAHGLEVPAGAAEDIEYRPTATYAPVPEKSVLESLCLQGTSMRDQEGPLDSARLDREQVPAKLRTSKRRWEYMPEDGADVLTLCGANAEEPDAVSDADGEAGNSEASWPHSLAPANCSMYATAGSVNSCRGTQGLSSGRRSAQTDPFEAALHEHITNLEMRASVALREKAVLSSRAQRELAQQERAKVARQAQLREHSDCLRQQIEANQQRRASEREPTPLALPRAPQSSHDLESAALESAGLPPATGPGTADDYPRPNALRDALDEQVQAKRKRQSAQRAFEQRIEARLLEAQAHEDMAQQSFEKASRVSERESLEAAWQEQTRIREIRKALEAMDSNGRAKTGGKASSLGRYRLALGGVVPGLGGDSSSTTASSRGGRSSSRGSCRGTPRHASAELATPLGSARGFSIGAAASLALQTRPGEAA